MLGSMLPNGECNGTDEMFVRSTDGGQTFSPPQRINDDPINHNKWHWLGTLAVAPNGRIDSVWLDTRNAANDMDSQLFYSFSMDGGNTWSPNVAVSNSFNPHLGYPNQNQMGDYITIVSDNTGGRLPMPRPLIRRKTSITCGSHLTPALAFNFERVFAFDSWPAGAGCPDAADWNFRRDRSPALTTLFLPDTPVTSGDVLVVTGRRRSDRLRQWHSLIARLAALPPPRMLFCGCRTSMATVNHMATLLWLSLVTRTPIDGRKD